ncbi:phosphoenolpyruvate synthase regulatory protein [Salipaludibacillus neizhouensis]|uniref:Putative pyruvate, phosphate dikinase regulatory protein n=1 Tax=Salipaludibacillus neizhouensis TaxID=885475 RepID=A0A3A9KVQ4_9BACI|nr:pyruvate, water dikinase regulatory protein [Salipaludibacillus neizhouensis]RKL68686.1 phosphoenolpyruvate synthase regulatory protein [Salipaludibacillus neizhouensis]
MINSQIPVNRSIVYVISDSVGETAELVVKAAISQFDEDKTMIQRIPYVGDIGTVDEVIALAKENHGMIAFTVVLPEVKTHLVEQAKLHNIPSHDILSPMVAMMEKKLQCPPKNESGLIHMLDEDYFKKVEAIEFAVKYDDGRDPRGILRADVVLVGVSRTSKTPLSQYLAHKRLKVANVPLVPEVEPPEELFSINSDKVIGLTISPVKLNGIRTERLKALGLKEEANYAKIQRIEDELVYSAGVMKRIGCEVIDVSTKAVEETANLIFQIVQRKEKE